MSLAAVRLSNVLLRNVPRLCLIKSSNATSNSLRSASNITSRYLSATSINPAKREMLEVTFETVDGSSFTVQGKEGDNLLDVVVNNDVDLDGFGACEGTLSCSTCHLIFEKEDFNKIEDPCTDEELDMLDLAYGLSDTSRLGCQVCLTKELNGLKVKVPEGTADAREM